MGLNRARWIGFVLSCQGMAAQVAADPLPVRRVILYKNGVGYFEHRGTVTGRQDVGITFTSGQLNDVLKSLTVLDRNGGWVRDVEYGAQAPLGRQWDELRLPVGEKATLLEVLSALRGSRVEIRSGTTALAGRLLSVDRKVRITGATTVEVDYVSLLADGGEVRTTELSPAFSVRLLEAGLAGKVGKFLDLVSAARQADVRRMTIRADGNGERALSVSYISEAPVWKSTYRVVLGNQAGELPLLQGWAIVDNSGAQDWDKVELSLAAGAPQSFIQQLSQPYYTRRPEVPVAEAAMAAPRTFEATLIPGAARLTGRVVDPGGAGIARAAVLVQDAAGGTLATAFTDESGSFTFPGLSEGAVRLEARAVGFTISRITGVVLTADRPVRQDIVLRIGQVSETVEVSAATSLMETSTSILRSSSSGSGRALGSGSALGGRSGGSAGRPLSGGSGISGAASSGMAPMITVPPAAHAQPLGDLYEYKLAEPVTIARNRSAMVPIVNARIAAEKVSVWNEAAGLPRPQRTLLVDNTSGATLDGGSFSVLDAGAFAGEGVFEPIRPGEKRLISYAMDLPLNATSENFSETQRVTRCRVVRGVMTQEREVRERRNYIFRNEDTAPRTVIVEHPVRAGYVLRSEVRPMETTAGWMRFRVAVPAKQTAAFLVEEARPQDSTFELSNLDEEQIGLLLKQKSITPAMEEAFRRIVAQKAVVAEWERKEEALGKERERIFDDQQRLRENLKSLKGSAEEKALAQRYTQQLNSQESRLEELDAEIKAAEKEKEAADERLDAMIEELVFDVKL